MRLTRPLVMLSCIITLAHAPAFAQLTSPQTDAGTVMPSSTSDYASQDYSATPLGRRETEKPTISVPETAPIVQVDQDVFNVQRIDVEGNTIISDAQMEQIVAPYQGRQLTTSDLTTLVGRINEVYRTKGYLTSLAFIPPQNLERGTITVKVMEGMVGEMEVSGNKYLKAKVIERRIAEKPGDPLNIPKLEDELLRINRQEPYRVKATLSPGDRTGETKIHLDVQEQQPYQIALVADNAGRPFIGTYRFGTELTDRNVTGYGDRFTARYMVGAGQQLASASYTVPLGSHGTEVSALFGFSHVDVDLGIDNQPQIAGNAFNYGVLLSQPLDKERNFVADIGLNARRVTNYFDHEDIGSDDIRSATVGLNYNHYDRLGRTFARISTTMAPEWLGANTHFWKAESFATRVVKLPKSNLLIFRSYGQWSPDALPPVEQFQLGGINSVRGYTEGLLIGDKGYTLSAEWRYPIPGLSHLSPWLADRVQGALFADYGQTWLNKDSRNYIAGVSNTSERTSLASVGFGVRARLTDYLQGYADVAFGLLNRSKVEPNAQPTARVHFGVRSELLPNDYKSRTDQVTEIKTNTFRPRSVGAIDEKDLDSDVADPTLEPIDTIRHAAKVY